MSRNELTAEELVELLGVSKNSIIYDKVYDLASELLNGNCYLNCFNTELPIEEQIEKIFGTKTKKEFVKALKRNDFVLYGSISDDDDIKSVFALDCKKIKKRKTIIDFSDWGY